ncbi:MULTISPECIES: MBL fold metallo-hydrolase [unclassified Streptomyces]|uniref:MBL fold metallo-hydrolase n=1 Tax=unclassified Streptomyces TaxID=2593676 RepID=UPI000DAB5148|nr:MULTISPECIES: MBL fold metallo-hydrolase [unclassified Streptomyces]PZT76124.1 MBL fold metallo-hydrolase [Streptomyces sp. AC1-42W]PZT79924.1 MBL fold metallo-hydrolase [Streptomyces sp. AC1-42T]
MTSPARPEVHRHLLPGVDPRIFALRVADEVDAFVVRTERFVALVDTLATPELCARALELIADETGGRPLLVVNTHADWDHVWGNAAVEGRAPIIGHRSAAARVRSARARDTWRDKRAADDRFDRVRLVAPTVTFDTSLTLDGGDLTLELLHTPGHTPDHIAVWIPQLRVCLAGDAAEDPLPELWEGDASSAAQLVASLELLRSLAPEQVLPSHGGTTDPALLDRNLGYFASLTGAYADAVRAGGPEFETVFPDSSGLSGPALAFYRACHRKAVRAAAAGRL